MKKTTIRLLIGILFEIIVCIALYKVYKLLYPGLTELYALLAAFTVLLVILLFIFKHKHTRIGLLIGGTPLLVFIVVSIIKEIPSKEIREFSKNYKVTESDLNVRNEYSHREDLMNDTTLNLLEKLNYMNFAKNKVSELSDIHFKIIGTDTKANKIKLTKNYDLYYKNFDLNYSLLNENSDKIWMRSKDSIGIKFNNGDSLKYKTSPDSYNYLGYLNRQNVHVFEKNTREGGIEYFSINDFDGVRLNGIPLVENIDSTLFADVHFSTLIGWLDLDITIWTKIDNSFEHLISERIPMEFFMSDNNKIPCQINYIYWDNSTLNFDLEALNFKEKIEKVKFEIEVKIWK